MSYQPPDHHSSCHISPELEHFGLFSTATARYSMVWSDNRCCCLLQLQVKMTSVFESVHAPGCATNAAWAGAFLETPMPATAQPMQLLSACRTPLSTARCSVLLQLCWHGHSLLHRLYHLSQCSIQLLSQQRHSRPLSTHVVWTNAGHMLQQIGHHLDPPTVLHLLPLSQHIATIFCFTSYITVFCSWDLQVAAAERRKERREVLQVLSAALP